MKSLSDAIRRSGRRFLCFWGVTIAYPTLSDAIRRTSQVAHCQPCTVRYPNGTDRGSRFDLGDPTKPLIWSMVGTWANENQLMLYWSQGSWQHIISFHVESYTPKTQLCFFFSWVAGRHPGIQTQSTVLPLYWNIMVCYQCLLIAWYHFRRSKALIVSSNTSFLFETLMWKRHLSGPSLAGREIRDSSLTLPVGQKLHQEIFNLAKPERKANQHPMAHQIPMMNSYVHIF